MLHDEEAEVESIYSIQLHPISIQEVLIWDGSQPCCCFHRNSGNCSYRMPVSRMWQMQVASTTIESSEAQISEGILPEYVHLAEVFSKAKATGLPPHRTYNCAINLLPGTTSPRNWIYPLSIAEQSESGIGQKGGGLCPCIDYRGLNSITTKYRYPLPLIPAALEQVRQSWTYGAHITWYKSGRERSGWWCDVYSSASSHTFTTF